MSKITLGSRPKNFKKTLQVPLHEGQTGTVEVSYVYRTRKEFGAFVDELLAAVPAAVPAAAAAASSEDSKYSLAAVLAKNVDTQADYIMRIVDGWNLDEPFNRANVLKLCDELPGASEAIIDNYRNAVSEGRLGN
jgi:hypothetical protein